MTKGYFYTYLFKVFSVNLLYSRDIVVVAGGVIPPQDYEELYQSGCAAVFGPGNCGLRVLKCLYKFVK